jgi:hypothetical protein
MAGLPTQPLGKQWWRTLAGRRGSAGAGISTRLMFCLQYRLARRPHRLSLPQDGFVVTHVAGEGSSRYLAGLRIPSST